MTSSLSAPPTSMVVQFREIGLDDVPTVGGKNASLGEMIRELAPLGARVPDGFAITADAFRWHLREAALEASIYKRLDTLDITDTRALAETAGRIREQVAAAPLPRALHDAIIDAYARLSRDAGTPIDPSGNGHAGGLDVAVRSSATAEDLPTASFAGQHETFLNVRGAEALDAAVRACMASLFTERAIVYRASNGFAHRAVALSVGVQRMVRSDLACAGTMFTLDTETGFRGVVVIEGSWGLGEAVVQGRVSPDEFWVHKATAKAGFSSLIRREMGDKAIKLVYPPQAARERADQSTLGPATKDRLVEVPVADTDRRRFVLSDDEALALARWAMLIEEHYTRRAGRDTPMDIEWARDGRTGELFILQARPETVHSQKSTGPAIETFRFKAKATPILTGKSVGARIGAGPVRLIRSKADLPRFVQGEVVVAAMTDPDWEPILRRAAAVVTDHGGRTCHAAIVSREIGLPCVVGTGHATERLRDGQIVTVSGAGGDAGHVYDGRLPFERRSLDPATLPTPRVPLMLNVADPAGAFRLGQWPTRLVAGVGLLRIEFLVSTWIGVHPMALVHPERVPDAAARAEIARRAGAHASPADFFVDRLAAGIAHIGAAFHPRPVIVRFSDFKTNEYAGLLGGKPFEPVEANPMIGFRGASRYHDERYREGFSLECQAIKRVRETMGLTNVIVMIPFCRTLAEGRAVLDEMKRQGLERGQNGLEVYVMCEIPSNAILGDEFADLFDGFSIGSNDLTQLTLGIDRDSDLLASAFDEQDPSVKRLIELVIRHAHAKGRKVGICGEAPSNHPEFARWLAELGIDSISLNPDSLPRVAAMLK